MWKYDKVLTETKMHSFFETRCPSYDVVFVSLLVSVDKISILTRLTYVVKFLLNICLKQSTAGNIKYIMRVCGV